MMTERDSGLLVSIITPVKNGETYLEECISSVLNQTYGNIEHIFIDACSTDGTLGILERYRGNYPERIRYISEADSGVGDALNKGFRLAKGDVFGWLDGDDIYFPDTIQKAVAHFTENPEIFYVYGDVEMTDETGKIVGRVGIREFDFMRVVTGRDPISLAAAFFRREVVEDVGGLNDIGNNFDFWIRIASRYRMDWLEIPFCTYRVHNQNYAFSKNTVKNKILESKLREDYLLCRKLGGGMLAPRCRKYYIFSLLNKLHLYNFLSDALSTLMRNRHHRIVGSILKIAGL